MAGLSRGERIKAMLQKLEALKAEEARLERKRKAALSKKERAAETRRKILVGALILERVERGDWPRERLMAMLDAGLSRTDDRALFGLAVAGAAVQGPVAGGPGEGMAHAAGES